MKQIVVPGELVGDSKKKIIEGIYEKDGKAYAKYLGVFYDSDLGIKVVPLNGKYEPKIGDIIIGVVLEDEPFIYDLDVNSVHTVALPKRNLDVFFNKNDVLLLRVTEVNEVKEMDVELVDTLKDGTMLEINPKKVPRVIGKSKSMINTIEKYTKTKLIVGANGFIYVTGEKPQLVDKVLEKIDEFSHVDQLTEKIEEFLKKIGE